MVAPLPPPGALAPRRPPASAIAEVRVVLEQQARLVDALDAAALRSVLPALIQARDELRRDLLAWLRNAPDGAERFTAQQYRRALVALEGSLARAAELGDDIRVALEGGAMAAGSLAMSNLMHQVARFGAVFGESITPIDIDTAAVLSQTQRRLFKKYRTSAARYAGQVGEDIKHQLAVGVARGETFAQLKARLVKHGGPRGMVALKGILGEPGAEAHYIAEGLFKRHRYWAERLVRTELIDAYSTQHMAGIDALNEHRDPKITAEYLVRWDATLDRRVCPVCKGLDRRVARRGGTFPGGYTAPPAHPQCRCVPVAWHASWGDMRGEVPVREDDVAQLPPQPTAPPPRPPRVRKPPTPAAIGAAAAPPPAPTPIPAPPTGDIDPAMKAMARGKWSDARAALEADLMKVEGYQQAQLTGDAHPHLLRMYPKKLAPTKRVKVRKLRPGVLGTNNAHNGEITLSTESAARAQSMAKEWNLGREDVRQSMAAIRDLKPGERATDFVRAHADALNRGTHTLVHETVHSFGPMSAQGAYKGAGVMVEEVATEVASRRYLRLRMGVPLELYETSSRAALGQAGAYNGWIDGVNAVIRREYGIAGNGARDVLEEAADAWKRRPPGTVTTPGQALDTLAADIDAAAIRLGHPSKLAEVGRMLAVVARMSP